MSLKENLISIVGSERVFDEGEILEANSRDYSLSTPAKPGYVVRAQTAEEIQKILKLANETPVPVTPRSSGVHFSGNTIPVQAGIVLDLSAMNKILEIDDRNRMVRVEPGVTWGQLQNKLAEADMMALSPLLPHPLKSVMTSHLEREPHLIPKFEYTDSLVTMELVLPDGEIFRTGSACVPGYPGKSMADGVNPSGPGDFMWNRIFTGAQGTLGIATWVKCKIEYRTKLNRTFFIPFSQLANAVQFIYRIQRRQVGEECLLLNKVNLAAVLGSRLPQSIASIKKSLSPWTVIMVLGGGKRLPERKIQYEETALKEVADDLSIGTLNTSLPGLPGADALFPDILRDPSFAGKRYWKFASRGACEDLFFLTTLNTASKLHKIVRDKLGNCGISEANTGIYIQPLVYGGACHMEYNIFYDGNNKEQRAKVKNFYMDAATMLLEQGAFFSRPYGPIASLVFNRAANTTEILKRLKRVFDPNNVMSPGRLCF